MAMTVGPDYLHCIWLPLDEADFSKRWRLIKSEFTRHCPLDNPVRHGLVKALRSGLIQASTGQCDGVWMRKSGARRGRWMDGMGWVRSDEGWVSCFNLTSGRAAIALLRKRGDLAIRKNQVSLPVLR
jgi:REP element-mobilizing transposase RayT